MTGTDLDSSLIFFSLIQETKVEFGIHKFLGVQELNAICF